MSENVLKSRVSQFYRKKSGKSPGNTGLSRLLLRNLEGSNITSFGRFQNIFHCKLSNELSVGSKAAGFM